MILLLFNLQAGKVRRRRSLVLAQVDHQDPNKPTLPHRLQSITHDTITIQFTGWKSQDYCLASMKYNLLLFERLVTTKLELLELTLNSCSISVSN